MNTPLNFRVGLFLYLLIGGCTSQEYQEFSGSIVLEELDVMEITIQREITETQEYIPGRLGELIVLGDGTIFVTDRQKITIEQFSRQGDYIGSISREGEGPGELYSPSLSLIDGGNNILIVRQSIGHHDFWGRGSDGLYRYEKSEVSEEFSSRPLFLLGKFRESEYLAKVNALDSLWTQYIVTVDPLIENIQLDSLHILKTPGAVRLMISGTPVYYGGFPYLYRDRIGLLEQDRYMIARPDSMAIFIYDESHDLYNRIDITSESQPISRESMEEYEYALNHAPDDHIRQSIQSLVPDAKPPFLNVWASKDLIVMHTDNIDGEKEIAAITSEGVPIGLFMISEYDNIQSIRGNILYSIYKNPELGDRIRLYEIPL